MKKNDLKKKYIQMAYKIECKEGRESVTIRRLGKELNCNPAMLYRCFNDLEELELYVGIRYLKEYINEVEKFLSTEPNSMEIYKTTWDLFIKNSFRNPKMYQAIFFGEYESKMTYYLEDYYEMFRDEFPDFKNYLKKIFLSGHFQDRDYYLLQQTAEDGWIKKDSVPRLSKMVVQLYKGYLKDFLDGRRDCGNAEDVEIARNEIIGIYEYLIELNHEE